MKKLLFILTLLLSFITLISCKSNNKTLKGFDIELAKEVGKELDVEVKFVEIVWEQKELELDSKNIDLIWNGLTITDNRKENLELSSPYLKNKQVIIGKDIQTLDLNKNYKIAVEAGSAGEDLLDTNEQFKNYTKIESNSQIDALTEVLAGTSDLAIMDSVMAMYYIKNSDTFKNLNVLDFEYDEEYYGIAARKGEKALINKINEILIKLYDNSKTLNIAKNYGLEDYIVRPSNDLDKSLDESLNYILNKKTLIIGYTIFAPVAYIE